MLFALLAVVVIAPFERALIAVPGRFTITTVEAVTLAALVVYAVSLLRNRVATAPHLPGSMVKPAIAFLATLLIAALAAPVEAPNALRFVARMFVAATLCLAAAHTINTRDRARLVASVMLIVATGVAIIGVLEVMQWPAVMATLTAFRPGFHVVAGQLRATSSLFYPTIASMYLEVAFVIGLWLLLEATTTRRRAVVFVALVVIGAGISATFTRAGLLAMAAALIVVAALRLTRIARERADLGVLTALATTLVVIVFVAHSPELLAARLTTEGSDAWYGAQYDVPQTLTMTTAGVHRVPVALTNTGRLTWDSRKDPAFALSYHWLRHDTVATDAVIEFEGQRTPFPVAVGPGARTAFEAEVVAPGEPGLYVLVWDVVHETRAWLSTEGVAPARSLVNVTGTVTSPVQSRMKELPPATIRPSRPALWSAALQIARAYPVLGIGPDNYRLAYGAYLGTARWDPRVHANNMYLEVLTGAGVVGLVTFLWLIRVTGTELWRRVQAASAHTHAATAAAFALLVVILGHGLVDSFLSFTTTYVMFAIAGGWALSQGLVDGGRDAHRV